MPDSLEQLRAAAAAAPADTQALVALARALLNAGQWLEAREVCRRGLALAPEHLGLAAVDFGAATLLGDAEGMHRGYQISGRLAPDDLSVLTHRAEAANRSIAPTTEELFEIHAQYGRALERQRPGAGAAAISDPNPDRPLRIGVLAFDYQWHSSVPFFLWPLFEHLDRSRFELWVYQFGPTVDEGTERFGAHAAGWRRLQGQSDQAVAAQIIADRIDIVLEIQGHTGVRRALPCLQPRCAPLQVSYAGYPNTTGVRSMDWRIVDSTTDPAPAADRLAVERLWRLDPCFLCYAPHAAGPSPSPAPCLVQGHITFGSMSEILKLNDGVLSFWARVVEAVPGSRLLLKNRAGDTPDARNLLLARCAAAGLDPARIDLVPRTAGYVDHLATYHRIDLALDTFPYNGTTTICESLLMGVPIIALHPSPAHDRHAARVAMSLLTAAGLPELIAPDPDAFVALAARLAADPVGLEHLHKRVREAFLGSPLCDAPAFAARFGAAVREMWRLRCSQTTK
jgi:predicted O-linked N-acetylglucosamine transferase (SPINDLY family)